MLPRFRPRASIPDYVGVSGKEVVGTSSDNTDGVRRQFPDSTDGTVVAGTTFGDLATGDLWYYDGAGWFRAFTVHDRILAELQAMRQDANDNAAILAGLLQEMRDALMKIA